MNPGPVVHYIDWHGFDENGVRSYDVKHDPDRCAQVEWFWGMDYACDVACMLVDAGDQAFGCYDCELDSLVPGRYVLEAWHETHPGGPWGPTEYSSGLRTGDRVA